MTFIKDKLKKKSSTQWKYKQKSQNKESNTQIAGHSSKLNRHFSYTTKIPKIVTIQLIQKLGEFNEQLHL